MEKTKLVKITFEYSNGSKITASLEELDWLSSAIIIGVAKLRELGFHYDRETQAWIRDEQKIQ